jgi:hypothetical protein
MPEPIKLLISIVERGRGSALMKLYTGRQVFLHCQCPGTGTATSDILNILGLGSSEKDVVLSWAAAGAAERLLTDLDADLRGAAKTTGIVFMLPLTGINNLVASMIQYKTDPVKPEKPEKKGEEKMEQSDSSLILVVCNRGCTDAVMATAKAAGARGGTTIRARWTGIEDLESAYDLSLHAEKEILAIVARSEIRNDLMQAINEHHGLRTESQAMILSMGIDRIVHL